MRWVFLCFVTLAAECAADEIFKENVEVGENNKKLPKQYAVLVAGSYGWVNYRHQADICHAYHILIRRGIPASNIIVLMKDDIANNTLNHTPGVIINKPNGTNVYGGVKIDYKGSDVTPKTFLDVLLGNKQNLKGTGSGRVLQSGPKDNVLIYFVGHGSIGFLCFPNEVLSAKNLLETLQQLKNQNKFSQLVLHVDAPEAGSMFDDLLPQRNKILASTSAAFDESSYGFYCKQPNYPCLGDLYSINWLEHLHMKLPSNENLFNQYQLMRTLTPVSHPYLYGDYRVGKTAINNFFGPHNIGKILDSRKGKVLREKLKKDAVTSHDIPLHWMRQMLVNKKTSPEKKYFKKMISKTKQKREMIDVAVKKIILTAVGGDQRLFWRIVEKRKKLGMNVLSCYENLYRLFNKKCMDVFKDPYALKHFYKFVNLCYRNSVVQERALTGIIAICNSDFQKAIQKLSNS